VLLLPAKPATDPRVVLQSLESTAQARRDAEKKRRNVNIATRDASDSLPC
jgi:hypothetical protein